MNRDFEEFYALLNTRSIDFLVVGGVAYNYWAPPRATKDVDLWVRPERGNLERLVAAIAEFGFPTDDVDLDALENEKRVLMLGRAPNRIDILTRPAGLAWEEVWERRVESRYGDARIFVLSLGDLCASKRAAGRPQDLADAAKLEEIQRRLEG